MSTVIIDGPELAEHTFIFAHGAGAGMAHDFMADVAARVASKGVRVVRFNFPYMIKRAEDGKKRPPDRAPVLLDTYRDIIAEYGTEKTVIGGKSMGGRMASHLGDIKGLKGIVCLGFPFHPPGKPEKDKGEHLATLSVPTLILQGERDTFGNRAELETYPLPESVQLTFIPDGDHSFKPRKVSGHTESGNRQLAADLIANFIQRVCQ
ncbi:alpha/beta hydrolase [Grimontia hollisae]|uniref:Alpha/beta hydrolase n=2 Tax=Grimontia hollisae TaxID=673 RepID=D0ICQ1_GRIHO|nr:alpha/beta fold hydrolase [Grimontia hollisae]AMG30032.1 alpha/beta hydrolase [Grimontia hollisae]EEY71669.1 alpha/beta hydrolase [Grimontia hollisae CIP 101886]MDF2183652.1 alpha/beta hydrolase [Grimontia hollisae]STO42816.1 Alpha/beta hydrolase family [Grimontia hollisae]STO56614.1 Alpha/beta hydrolase family [Grimontia hollisae]